MPIRTTSLLPILVLASLASAQCGLTWADAGSLPDRVTGMAVRPSGVLVVGGGHWPAIGSGVVERIGNAWVPFGNGAPRSDDLTILDNGGVLLAGFYQNVPTYGPAQYWPAAIVQPWGTQHINQSLIVPWGSTDITELADGTFVMRQRWSSSGLSQHSWQGYDANGMPLPLPAAYGSYNPEAIVALPAGGFVSCYSQQTATIDRFFGGSWTTFAPAPFNASVTAMFALANGDLIVTGDFSYVGGTPADHIARWDGSAWSAMGTGLDAPARHCLELAGGDLVFGGEFATAGGQTVNHIARWNGTTWSGFGAGTNGVVNRMAQTPDGTLWVGGQFTQAGGSTRLNIARLVPSCAPSVTPYGSGCAGSGGTDVLESTRAPWVGGAISSRATGLPAIAIAVGVYGFAPTNVPLALITPLTFPGCDVLATPDVLVATVATAGVVELSLPLDHPSLFGGQLLYHQVVSLGIDATGALTEWTATNGLELTVGEF